MTIKRRAGHHNVIPTASMADIAMLLLIFFMSTTIIQEQDSSQVRLPGATAGESLLEEAAIRIALSRGGAVTLNDAPIALVDVGPALGGKLQRNPELLVSLHADARAPYETVALLIEQLKAARAPRVALAVERRERS
ncbi:MAG TPA: biopolymer transporter ExbD [Candidatus Eisenbacteria bacterium]|nr:biopolymer transporter ExbD [Candidatus Eisenbacteria bacterium]